MINTEKKNDLNIVIIAYFYPPEYSGAGKQFSLLASELIKMKNVSSISILTKSKNNRFCEEKIGDVNIYRFPLLGEETSFINSASFAFNVLRHVISNQKKYNVLQFINISSFVYLIIFALKIIPNNIRLFARISLLGGDDLKTIEKTRYGKFKIKLLSSIDGVVSTSEAITSCSRKTNFIGNLFDIGNTVDSDLYKPVANNFEKKIIRNKLDLDDNVFIASFSGAFIERKGFDFLIKSWEVFIKSYPDSILLLIGFEVKDQKSYDSSFLTRAKSFITNMDNYRFISSERINDYLSCSDVFLFPSLMEGVPNSVVEAKASGLPVVVRKKPWVTVFLVENEYDGLVVESDSYDDFAEAIITLAKNNELAAEYGIRARNKVENKLKRSKIAGKYIHMYLNK